MGSEDGDTGDARGDGQDTAVVVQEGDRGPGQGRAHVPAVGRERRPGAVLFEQTQPELEPQDPGDGGVEDVLAHQSPFDRLRQVGEPFVPEAQIHTGAERQGTGGHRVAGDAGQPVHGQAVRHDQSVEAPALAQQPREQSPVARAGKTVDLVVRGHDGGGAGPHAGVGGGEVDLVEFPGTEFGLGGVAAPDGGALPGEVLEDDRRLVGGEEVACALHAPDQCLGEPGGQVRVLGVALLGTAPARIAGDVQRGHQGDMAAAGPQFGRGVGGGGLVQLRVPGGADGQVDGQDSAV